MVKGRLSIVIPNFNSRFASKTVQDILDKSKGDIEVIVNVEQEWPTPLSEDSRVHYIHGSSPIGMRAGINKAVALSKGEFIMKCDDHVMFGEGFDEILIDSHEEDNWIQIPRRYALDAEKWAIEERTDNKYPIDYMYIDFPRKGKDHDDGMHGVPWRERRLEREAGEWPWIDDTPSMQGSCYFMTKNHFDNFLHGLHEEGYGQFAQESQEIGFKTWLGGGALQVNKKTWYAHLHKGSRYGRFYKFPGGTIEASSWSASHWLNNEEPNMIHKFEWFVNEKFPDMPGWSKEWKQEIIDMGWIKN